MTSEHASPAEPKATLAAAVPPVAWDARVAIGGTALLFFGSQILVAILLLLAALLFGWNQKHLIELIEESITGQFVYILVAEGIVLFGLAAILRRYKSSFKTLGLIRPHWRDLWWALAGFAVYIPLLIATMMAAKALVPSLDLDQEQKVGFEAARGARELSMVFVALCVLPPLTEELLVRGFLYLGLRRNLSPNWALIWTSVLFAAAHLQFGSGAPLLWTAALDTFLLSVVLIYLRNKTGALWASIILHGLKNSLAFMALFVFK